MPLVIAQSGSPAPTQPQELAADFPIQDFVVINGDASPGQVRVLGANSPRSWDERQGYGLSGATLVSTGDHLAKFTLRFEFWDPKDIPAWRAFAAKYFDKAVRYVPGSVKPRALAISHPKLTMPPISIVQCVVEDADELDQEDEGDLWVCQVYMRQYRRPKAALSLPDPAISAIKPGLPTATDAQDREINALEAQRQATANP